MGSLWFLWSVFFCSIVVAVISKIQRRWKQRIAFIVGFLILVVIPEKIEYCKVKNLWMYPYFMGGYLFHQCREQLNRNTKRIAIICSIIIFGAIFPVFHKEYYIYTSGLVGIIESQGIWKQIAVDLYRWILGFFGAVAFGGMVELMLWRKQGKGEKVKIFISQWGRKSLQIYILQNLLLECLFVKGYNFIAGKVNLGWIVGSEFVFSFIIAPLFTLLFLWGIMLIIRVIEKIELGRTLFGR